MGYALAMLWGCPVLINGQWWFLALFWCILTHFYDFWIFLSFVHLYNVTKLNWYFDKFSLEMLQKSEIFNIFENCQKWKKSGYKLLVIWVFHVLAHGPQCFLGYFRGFLTHSWHFWIFLCFVHPHTVKQIYLYLRGFSLHILENSKIRIFFENLRK